MSVILKKKFGQNFLIDNNNLNKISNLIPSENLNILEIGPGNGRLTDKILLKKPSKLTLIEIDNDLIENLKKKYQFNNNVKLINADILKILLKTKYQLVISNLPYNISSQILVKLSLLNYVPEILILMFQKEFAKRLLDKKLNSINSLVRCFYDVKLKFNVSKNCFRPIPKVDSTVLTFRKIKKRLITKKEINDYIIFKRKLFSHKRKSLRNILKKYKLNNNFDSNLRVENLKLEQLIRLFRETNF
ncbi:16S rRNA (adenine(1518)-N(6)/adenine(1519)-N(6))-dimethyltransferase RsmA [Alphaproteobacteria bacterium]|nr:16S rRNA (adenine(1518)-N(6)/adenine(1519)-N(6))-dimethyltransferase RsmA [Alphaproteobacteria bacterium]